MPKYSPLLPERPFVIRELYTVHYFEYASGYAFQGEKRTTSGSCCTSTAERYRSPRASAGVSCARGS